MIFAETDTIELRKQFVFDQVTLLVLIFLNLLAINMDQKEI